MKNNNVTCKVITAPYVIQNQDFISLIPSPYYNNSRPIQHLFVVRDTEDYKKEVLKRQFQNACELFAHQVQELETLQEPLTTKGQHALRTSLETLLELHTLLKKK